jgi:hypothetical protein
MKIWTDIQNAFSASSLASLRNVLSALAFFIGALGVAGLTVSSMQHLVDLIMGFGTAGAVLITAISGMIATAMPIIAWFKSTLAEQKKSVAAQPNTIVVQTASQADTQKVANTAAAMTEVTLVTSSASIATAAPSNKVVSK